MREPPGTRACHRAKGHTICRLVGSSPEALISAATTSPGGLSAGNFPAKGPEGREVGGITSPRNAVARMFFIACLWSFMGSLGCWGSPCPSSGAAAVVEGATEETGTLKGRAEVGGGLAAKNLAEKLGGSCWTVSEKPWRSNRRRSELSDQQGCRLRTGNGRRKGVKKRNCTQYKLSAHSTQSPTAKDAGTHKGKAKDAGRSTIISTINCALHPVGNDPVPNKESKSRRATSFLC